MVRSAGGNAKILAKTLQDLMADVAERDGSDNIRIFYRENIETDICIVLFPSEEKVKTGGSSLGIRIVASLKEVGLVHHTIWNEMAQ